MNKVLPFLIKIILWGSVADMDGKKVSVGIRVVLLLLMVMIYLGLSALLFWVGFAEHTVELVIFGVLCLISIPSIILLEIKTKNNR